ncbi:hypothetical protein H2204_012788 [Knufia peltigerae]|uniref:Xylanolytic transcriptional activator regulatory domain-containing protein n=1 Tax=Knufia peltigerae TaxID=1002370 RepID=A0AA38XRS1_9EURO|nr:hypothetical protein H2204_012788 [Knufia peltigerae]
MTVFEPPHHTEKPIISSPSTVISAPSFLNNPNLLLGGNLTAVGPELSHFDDVMHSHGDDGRVAQERTMTADQGVEQHNQPMACVVAHSSGDSFPQQAAPNDGGTNAMSSHEFSHSGHQVTPQNAFDAVQARSHMSTASGGNQDNAHKTTGVASSLNGESSSVQGDVFYGPTCNLHVSSPSNVVRSLPRTILSGPEVHIDMDSLRLKNMLLNNYCNFQTLSVSVIHRESFLSHRDRGLRSQHYSVFLENSVLACAARLSTSAAVRSLAPSYAKRAKSEIVMELEDANMATLRGMLTLSDFEMSEGRDRVGWMYCGIACRLIFDLGLHKGWTVDGQNRAIDHNLEDDFSSVALGCLVYETLWSFYLGRPAHIALSNLSIPLPAANIFESPTLKAWFELSLPMSEITLILNGPSTTMHSGSINRLWELHEHLTRWSTSLPADIALDSSKISALDQAAYGLHMQYLRVQMLLHSISQSNHKWSKQGDGHEESEQQQPASESIVMGSWTFESSRRLVHLNAIKIAQLGATYRQIYGVENTPSVMLDTLYVAAATLTSSALLASESSTVDENDIFWLRTLDEMMKDLQAHFSITARMRSTLARAAKSCAWLADVFTDDVHIPSGIDDNINGEDVSSFAGPSHGAWGTMQAAVNDFIFDPNLLSYVDFGMLDDDGE